MPRQFNYEKKGFIPFSDIPKAGLMRGQVKASNRATTRLATDYGPMCGWIYTKIFSHADNKTHKAKFTQKILTYETGCDESTIRDYINLLCEIGYITLIKKGYSVGNRQEPSEYKINDVNVDTGYLIDETIEQFPKHEHQDKQKKKPVEVKPADRIAPKEEKNASLEEIADRFICEENTQKLSALWKSYAGDKCDIFTKDKYALKFIKAIYDACANHGDNPADQDWKIQRIGLAIELRQYQGGMV